MNDLSGQSLGRYHLIEKLGEGGMAVVYKAFDTRLECEVAVKLIRTDQLAPAAMDNALARFEREAKAVAQLTHANIVKVTDYGEYEGSPYLVMEYLAGGTLKRLMGQPVPYDRAAQLLLPIAKALQYAHDHHVIHRDVKPSNILITESGEPMLTDFGIAKILDLQEGQTLTGTGVGVGTPEYMAPEQWMGKITPAVDVYSLGVVFYELVTGKKPYSADTPAAVLLKSVSDPLPTPSLIVSGLTAEVDRMVFKALSKDPANRYQNMNQFAIALNNLGLSGEGRYTASPSNSFLSDENIDSQTTRDELETMEEASFSHKSVLPPSLPADPAIVSPTKKQKTWQILTFILAGVVILILGIGALNGWFFHSLSTSSTPAVAEVVIPTLSAPSAESPAQNLPTATSQLNEANISSLVIGSTQVSSTDEMTMVYVPAGDFVMGSPTNQGSDDEHPQHTIYLDAFWVDQTEITNGMYARCVSAGVCAPPQDLSSSTRESYYNNGSYNNYPVIHVSWSQANAYCQWAGRELPTEAQWEKAARGTDGWIYSWGNTFPTCSKANFAGCVGDTQPVMSYPDSVNLYGAYDMLGNVWEWVADYYRADYYAISSQENPIGPTTGTKRSLRGGSWYTYANYLTVSNRLGDDPTSVDSDYGFRCVMNPQN